QTGLREDGNSAAERAGSLVASRRPEGPSRNPRVRAAKAPCVTDPPRLFRRLHFLRGWSYEEVYEIFARSPRTRGAHGVRARERVPVAVGGDRIDRVKDWVHGRDVARLGASS